MHDSDSLEELRKSLDAERLAMLRAQETFATLTAKMLAFQCAGGPQPTVKEFKAWRLAVIEEAKTRKLIDG